MRYRRAVVADAPLLAGLNRQLIRDEGSRNPMGPDRLEARMRGWLEDGYEAVLFEAESAAGYALYRFEPEGVFLRQFFVMPENRRRGVGRRALAWLEGNVWAGRGRLRLEVLAGNRAGLAFWRSAGCADYALTLEKELGT